MENKKYDSIYNSQKRIYKRMSFLLRRDTDADVIAWLERDDTPTPASVIREAVREAVREAMRDE